MKTVYVAMIEFQTDDSTIMCIAEDVEIAQRKCETFDTADDITWKVQENGCIFGTSDCGPFFSIRPMEVLTN